MSTRLQRLCVDVEIAVHEHAARVRRHLLGTTVHEAMPAYPERIRDLDPESQDTFDDIAMDVLDQRLFHLLTRTGWAR
ncbi:hypothetical protein AB0I72_19715 [Nocardiopsis sp. NPDC049922]|uniref:hypothetical protein n=1 Tax=Nocardiopsis sp. NPDC049922 TaxID=3155157 RepID=UPI0033C0BC1A